MVNLPVTDNDNLKRLNSIFESGKVTLSYKFYWLLAIIDELEQRQKANKSLRRPSLDDRYHNLDHLI